MSVIRLNESNLKYVVKRILKEFVDYTLEQREDNAREIISTIKSENGLAILQHNSNKKIENGIISIGMPANSYSSDEFRADPTPRSFFWGTDYGRDVSNNSTCRYYCSLPINEIYPLGTGADPKSLKTLKGVMDSGYSAAAYYMYGVKENGTVVVCFKNLPINKIIKLSDAGTIFDGNWNFVSTTNKKWSNETNSYVPMAWDPEREKLI